MDKNKTAADFLNEAAKIMEERGKQYDKPDGERSMGRCVTAFNAITGRDVTESEGWLLLQLLKDVRQWQRAGFHLDSAEDCVAYAALKAEAKQQEASSNAEKAGGGSGGGHGRAARECGWRDSPESFGFIGTGADLTPARDRICRDAEKHEEKMRKVIESLEECERLTAWATNYNGVDRSLNVEIRRSTEAARGVIKALRDEYMAQITPTREQNNE